MRRLPETKATLDYERSAPFRTAPSAVVAFFVALALGNQLYTANSRPSHDVDDVPSQAQAAISDSRACVRRRSFEPAAWT
jgi:hypothetical protein